MTCKHCGARLLFWECTHGSRVMLEFDRRGRLSGKHRCKQLEAGGGVSGSRKRRPRPFDYAGDFGLSSITRKTLEKFFSEGYRCPACGVEFLTEESYMHHFKQKRNYDDEHHQLYQEYRNLVANTKTNTTRDDDLQLEPLDPADDENPVENTGDMPVTVATAAGTDESRTFARPGGRNTTIPPPENTGVMKARPGDRGMPSIQSFGRVVIKTKNGKKRLVFHSGDWYDEWKRGQEEQVGQEGRVEQESQDSREKGMHEKDDEEENQEPARDRQ